MTFIWDRLMIEDACNSDPMDKVTDLTSERSSSEVCSWVRDVLKPFGARRLFVGHTPVQSLHRSGALPVLPLVFCNGTLYDVDVGISWWMYGNPVNLALEIDDATHETVRVATMVTTPLGPLEGRRRRKDRSRSP